MPKFPTYRGELPECLNPLNPRHYLLLLYWIFFRPTALKCYLYQADPEIYRSKMGKIVFQTRQIPAYYNLYIMMPSISMFLATLLNLPVTLLTGQVLGISVNWLKWAGGLTFGSLLGMLSVMAVGMVFCVSFDLATGVTVGVESGILGSTATGVWVAATAGLGVSTMTGKTLGIAFAILAGVIIGIAVGGTFSMKAGVMTGVIGGLASGIMMSLIVNLLSIVEIDIKFGVAAGLVGGVVACIIIGVACGVGSSLANNTEGGVSFGIVCSILITMIFDMKSGLFVGLGTLRLVFYPFQFVLALCSGFSRIKHPIEWDELTVLPLPYTQRILTQRFRENEHEGLYFLIDRRRNSFRQAVIQKVLHHHLHDHSFSLNFLYKILTDSDFEEYAIMPTSTRRWESNISVNRLLMGELALRFVETQKGNTFTSLFDQIVWWTTYPLREHHRSPLTAFAGMLYELMDEGVIKVENFTLSSYAKIYTNVSSYPGGQEIAETFDVMAAFLSYSSLSDLVEAHETSLNLSFDNSIRPTVLSTLTRLGKVGAEVKTYQDSSSRANRMAALARATDALKMLDEYAQAEVMAPEQYLLRRIIRQWQALLISAGGVLGRAVEVGPVVNPYIAGNPVSGELFVGREDILRRLEELWSGAGQKPSVVLYGHRRMGKSSILHNLGTRFGQNTQIIDFNMQRAGLVSSTGELLHNLALTIYDALPTPNPSQEGNRNFSEPEEKNFLEHNPYTAFDRFLKQVDRIRGAKRFIITIDEFEMIEQKIQQGRLEPLLLDFWRGLIQTYPWIIMAFAGLHTLQEMTRDYWNPLFGSVTGIPVSFLKESAAKRLITQPSADFALDYDQDAISEIVRLTYGQPYLVQLICHCLVSHFNRQTFEEGIERERRFHLSDVEAVIAAPEFFRDGEAYFSGVWQQARHDDRPEVHELLKVLAQAEAGLSIEDLVTQSGLALEQVQSALTFLQRHDLATETEGNWKFTVELMRRWVLRNRQ